MGIENVKPTGAVWCPFGVGGLPRSEGWMVVRLGREDYWKELSRVGQPLGYELSGEGRRELLSRCLG